MGGCLDKPVSKKNKNNQPSIRQPQSNKIPANRQSIHESVKQQTKKIIVVPKYHQITINQFLTTYKIQETVQNSSKMQGPKFITNIADGTSKVLRIVQISQINEKRLKTYKQLIKFQIFQYEQGNLLILDEYCSGKDILQYILDQQKQQNQSKIIKNIILDIINIILQFHKNNIWLGHLTFSSFKFQSYFNKKIRLVDFNFTGSSGDNQKVGFAYKQGYQSDYQFIGFLLQLFLIDQPSIFVSHKMQYIQFQSIPHSQLIFKLLKGSKINKQLVQNINQQLFKKNNKTALGYLFRRDINKLLKLRKKRKGHNKIFYGEDMNQFFKDGRFIQQFCYRYESDRVFKRIQIYINQLKSIHQQPFLNYGQGHDSLRKLKQVFMLVTVQKKLNQLKQIISSIK